MNMAKDQEVQERETSKGRPPPDIGGCLWKRFWAFQNYLAQREALI